MNNSNANREGGNQGYRTHRSERYRHPERGGRNDFDDYGTSARGGYGNERYGSTRGNQGSEMGGSRNFSRVNITDDDTYSTSRNYGNMGSYGGAQGFGTSRGGNIAQRHYGSGDTGYHYESGMGNPREARDRDYSPGGHRAYGYRSDYDSHGSNTGSRDRDRYGSEDARRFEGSHQDRYYFDQGSYNQGSGQYSNRDRDRGYRSSSGDRNREGYRSPNYGGAEGNYMGSGYRRSSQGDYGPRGGDYGSGGSYGSGLSNDQPYGLSGYYSGGYGGSGSGYVSADSNYMDSQNRGRTFDRDRGDDRNRPYGGRY